MSRNKETESQRLPAFAKNPRIDMGTVNAYEKLERQLKKLGVKVKPEYGIEPPLGFHRSASQTPRR